MRLKTVVATTSYIAYLLATNVTAYQKLQDQNEYEQQRKPIKTESFYSKQAFDGIIADMKESINSIWILTAAINICLMQLGFAFVEVGSIHRKNTTNILFKNLVDTFFGAMGFFAFGHAFGNNADGGLFG